MKKISFLILFACFLLSSCFVFRKVDIKTGANSELVESPVKVHLKNGQNVLFRDGANFQGDRIYGDGELYDLDLEFTERIEFLEMDDVAVYEVFTSKVLAVPTVLVSSLATALITPPLMVAIFGSCPTVYYTDEAEPVLQAELFSNSIAPMLEKRDVVRLGAKPEEDGNLRLEIRNEALETHYINHIELLQVFHEENEFIVPSNRNRPLALSDFITPNMVVNGLNENISDSFHDNNHFYQSSLPAGISSEDGILWDYVELTFDSLESDHIAVHFNLRNTLYSTVLLYDFMLAARGQKALDWLGKELSTVSGAVALGSFSQEYLGMRIDLNVEGEYIEVGRIPNVGPISWKDVAVEITDIPMNKPLQIRLRFLQDSWHIKNLRLATSVRSAEYTRVPVSGISSKTNPVVDEIQNRINAVNDDYLITTPGTSMFFDFKTQITANNFNTTFLLAAQGYYLEWIRPAWLEAPAYTIFPDYSPEMIVRSQNRWLEVKDEFEEQFFSTKIPVQ